MEIVRCQEPEPDDDALEQSKDKKKRNLAQDMKEKLSFLRRRGDTSPRPPESVATPNTKDAKPPKLTGEAVKSWNKSLDNLLSDKNGLQLFREFLRTEFSEENLEFWIACEEYKALAAEQLVEQAQKIFTDFIAIQAPREINLDSKTRELTAASMSSPDARTFEVAQKRIQALMQKDSYPRFLRSSVYRGLLSQFKISLAIT